MDGSGLVTIRELRNHGSDVIDRVEAGECLIVTRAGRPVAELRPTQTPLARSGSAASKVAHSPGDRLRGAPA